MSPPAVHLVMPMAGRGSRFARAGITQPKPLVDLFGRPFFWWACESLRRSVPLASLSFVVLRDHCVSHGIDAAIRAYYPSARIVAIEQVTGGAAETAMLGVAGLDDDLPIAINDCDHAFCAPKAPTVLAELAARRIEGALMTFRANSPAYSYVSLDPNGAVLQTVEKQVVSDQAIAGCYFFASTRALTNVYDSYRRACAYDELFLSGVYNAMLAEGARIGQLQTTRHYSFGTPEELASLSQRDFLNDFPWLT